MIRPKELYLRMVSASGIKFVGGCLTFAAGFQCVSFAMRESLASGNVSYSCQKLSFDGLLQFCRQVVAPKSAPTYSLPSDLVRYALFFAKTASIDLHYFF